MLQCRRTEYKSGACAAVEPVYVRNCASSTGRTASTSASTFIRDVSQVSGMRVCSYAECTVSPFRVARSFCRARHARSCLSNNSQPPLPDCMQDHSGVQSHSSPPCVSSSAAVAVVDTPRILVASVARRLEIPPARPRGVFQAHDAPTTSTIAPAAPDAPLTLSQRGIA